MSQINLKELTLSIDRAIMGRGTLLRDILSGKYASVTLENHYWEHSDGGWTKASQT